MKTEQQIKNLQDALVWWQTVPEANVSRRLGMFTEDMNRETNCRTVACFGGWAARWPSLVQQGLSLAVNGVPKYGNLTAYDVALPIFGDDQIFHPRGAHEADGLFYGSDHALVTNRIRWALAA